MSGMWRRVSLGSGVLAAVLYVVTTVIAATRWEDYSAASQTISELFAIGAPSRTLVVVLFSLHNVLLCVFAAGVWQSSADGRALRAVAALLAGIGAVGAMTTAFFPIHLRGTEPSATDTAHAVFTAVIVLFILLAVAFGSSVFGRGFRVYSWTTLATLVVFGALAGRQGGRLAADAPTPWLGVYERVNIGGYLLWLAVLAVLLLFHTSARSRAARCPDRRPRQAKPL